MWKIVQEIAQWLDGITTRLSGIHAEQQKQTAILQSILREVTRPVASLNVTLGAIQTQKEK